MPSSSAVLDQLTPIIVQVVGCEPETVVLSARLKQDLDVDSLSIVEVVEKLGVTFGVYIPDDDVDRMRTVKDVVNSVVNHDPAVKGPNNPASTVAAARFTPQAKTARALPAEEIERRKHVAWKFAWVFAGVGLALGLVFGLGGAALVDASGLKNVDLPPGPAPTTTATTTAPVPAETTKPAETPAAPSKKPTITAASTSISPGENLRLTGKFPGAGDGASLQVQVKDAGSGWDDFPVVTATKDADGSFATVIFTTRTGVRQFRLLNTDTDKATPAVTVTIG